MNYPRKEQMLQFLWFRRGRFNSIDFPELFSTAEPKTFIGIDKVNHLYDSEALWGLVVLLYLLEKIEMTNASILSGTRVLSRYPEVFSALTFQGYMWELSVENPDRLQALNERANEIGIRESIIPNT